MNVHSQEKLAGSIKKIQIKNNDGRLSQTQIIKIVPDADKYKHKLNKAERNPRERRTRMALLICSQLNQRKIRKTDTADKEENNKAVNGTLARMQSSKDADDAMLEAKQTEIKYYNIRVFPSS